MDLKPSNLLVKGTNPPILKLADFGFAQHLEEDSKDKGLKGEIIQDWGRTEQWLSFVVRFTSVHGPGDISIWSVRRQGRGQSIVLRVNLSCFSRQTSGPLESSCTRYLAVITQFSLNYQLISGTIRPGTLLLRVSWETCCQDQGGCSSRHSAQQ